MESSQTLDISSRRLNFLSLLLHLPIFKAVFAYQLKDKAHCVTRTGFVDDSSVTGKKS